MWQGMRRRALAGIVAIAGMAALAPAASAAISPKMTVTTPTPVAAGSATDLGLDLTFSPTGGDAPDQVILNLPPGVLANASIDNGQCISGATPTDFSNDAACLLGSGQVSSVIPAGGINVPVPDLGVNFYLVPPPAAGDLAGLAVATGAGDQVGAVNAIKVRPSGDPDGVGVTLDLTLPNNLDGVSVAITEINSTFTATRMPTTCPATPAQITLSANSYGATGTFAPASAPLPVTGCSALPYAPRYSLTATRDSGDKMVKLSTTITQAPTESPNSAVTLAFPLAVVTPAISGLASLCPGNPATSKCTPVGTVTAQSPDYPLALTGQAFLTGSINGLSLTLIFPSPFPLTLVGAVDLKDNTTTFTGLPDIPLTSLAVTLNSGKSGLFSTNCATRTGTSTASLTDQNGDKSVKLPAKFTLTGCPTFTGGGTGSGSGSAHASARPHVTTSRLRGLRSGRPSLTFRVRAGRHSRLRSLNVKLPKGLSFRGHRVHKKTVVRGVKLKGGKLKSARLRKGHLVITLRRAARAVTVTVRHAGLKESRALRAKARSKSARKRLRRMRLTVVARNSKGKRTTIKVKVKHLGL